MEQASLPTALVALSEAALPDENLLSACLASWWPETKAGIRFFRHGETIRCEFGATLGVVGVMPVPIADAVLGPALNATPSWSAIGESMRSHRAHLMCSVTGQEERRAAATHLTRLIAGICTVLPAQGVYWGPSGRIHSPEGFVEVARTMGQARPPLDLWVRFILSQSKRQVHLRTRGMRALGFMELEIVASEHGPDRVVPFARSIAHYLLVQGAVLGDGHTVGRTAEEKVAVRHTRSLVEPAETVYRLSF